MSLFDIINMIPKSGNSEWDVDRYSVETKIDKAFEHLIEETDSLYFKGYYQGIYVSYIYMTTMKTPWEDIREFLVSEANFF